MKTLYIDVETTSKEKDLKRCGAYRYAESARILLFGYAYDDGQVIVADVANGDTVPDHVLSDLTDPAVQKVAHNASFERTILTNVYGLTCDPHQWICTAAWSAHAGLPRGLDKACAVAKLPGKLVGGTQLIRKFCVAGKSCEGPDWEEFKKYNLNDVEIERALHKYLFAYPMPANEWELWQIDQEINDRGFLIDLPFVNAAIKMETVHKVKLIEEARKISGLENPNSVAQLKGWLGEEGEIESLNKKAVERMLETAQGDRKRILEIRQQCAMSSVKKYQSLANAVCKDGRVRGTLLYYGAHTGRWSGRLFQPHNLPRIKPVDPVFIRELVLANDAESLELYFGDIQQTLSSMIRSSVIAPPGGYLRVDDFSAIEARICAWLAKEKWILDTFAADKPYYEATASRLFHIPIDDIVKGCKAKDKRMKEFRQKGKVAALSLQYQGSVGALQRMGGLDGSTEEEMLELVYAWREICPAIVNYWARINSTAVRVVQTGGTLQMGILKIRKAGSDMYIDLPSNRSLIYRDVCITESKKTGEPAVACIVEEKTMMIAKQLYGGLILENIVQALARDFLAEHLRSCHASCILHVHDEVILENNTCQMKKVSWAHDLPMKLEGFTSPFYRKD